MSKIKMSDCTACAHREKTAAPQWAFQEYRCRWGNFYVGDTVMDCRAFKRARVAA